MSRSDKHSKQKTSSKTSKGKKIFLSSLLVVLLALFGGYAYRSSYYSNHFLPKTYVEATDVSGLTTDQANKKLHDRFDAQTFSLTENGTEWKSYKKSDFGLQTDFSDELNAIKKGQNQWKWGIASFSAKENHSLKADVFDEEILAEQMESLQKELDTLNEDRKPTENATITKGEDGFSVKKEVVGDQLDTKQVATDVKENLLSGSDEVKLESYKKEPRITSDDENLKKEVDDLNQLAKINASYVINGETIQIPTETIADWLSYKDEKVALDQEKVQNYVNDLASKYNTSTNSSKFNSSKQGEVEVPAGTLSWTMDRESEAAALSEAILSGEDFTRSPIVQGSADPSQPLFDNTYIEVDLENQHMWYYKDGKVELETDIISGKPKSPTPKGVFYVWKKERDATLTGEDYSSPVDYWMPIDWTGVGIHDSDWQTTYGGDRWKTVGSHGCVNTPPEVMKALYNSVEVGVPVIVI